MEVYVGVGPKRIRDLFDSARSNKEGCIIFIDELDALGARNDQFLSNRETTATLNQLLS